MKYDKFSPQSDLNVCPIHCLKEYICRTATLRQEHTKLFIITCEPFSPAKNGTLCRWVKMIMDLSGIDIMAFGPHSICSATSSKAWETGVSLDSIMKRAGWSCQNTFVDHYLRDVKPKTPSQSGSHDFVTPMPPIIRQHGVLMGEKIRQDQNLARKTKNSQLCGNHILLLHLNLALCQFALRIVMMKHCLLLHNPSFSVKKIQNHLHHF